MVYEARYLGRNCELKTRLGDIVSHLRHLSHLSQDKTKLLFSFFLILFNYAIQGKFITWLVNSALNCTWKPISHSSLRDSCDIGFRVQFNAEFPRQVMNFPIVFLVVYKHSVNIFFLKLAWGEGFVNKINSENHFKYNWMKTIIQLIKQFFQQFFYTDFSNSKQWIKSQHSFCGCCAQAGIKVWDLRPSKKL